LTLALLQGKWLVELSKKEDKKKRTLHDRFQEELVIVRRIINEREKSEEAHPMVIRIVRSIHKKHQQQKAKKIRKSEQ
jgi:hypothetical protein